MESCWFSVHVGIQKLVLVPVKGYRRNRTDELAGQSEGKQAKTKTSIFHIPLSQLHQKLGPGFGVGLPASDDLIKEIPPMGAQQPGV